MTKIALKNQCILLSNDSDFYVFPLSGKCRFCQMDDFWPMYRGINTQTANNSRPIFLKCFDPDNFSSVHNVSRENMIFLPVLLGNDFVNGTSKSANQVKVADALEELKDHEFDDLARRYGGRDSYALVRDFYGMQPPFADGMCSGEVEQDTFLERCQGYKSWTVVRRCSDAHRAPA